MADQFIGDAMDVYYNTVDIGGTARTVTVDVKAASPPEIDCTHKGDTEQNLKEGIPGGIICDVSLDALDESGGVSAMKDFAVNAIDTLFIYPEGKTAGHEQLTIQNARFLGFTETIPYDGAVGWVATFNAKNSVTRATIT